MELAVYQYVYLYITLLSKIIFYSFNIYILLNEDITKKYTKAYIIIQNIYSTVGITLMITFLLYLKFKKTQINGLIYESRIKTINNTKYNFFIIMLYLYNIIDIVMSISYIYKINNKYMYPLNNGLSPQNHIDRYLLNDICYNYVWILVNIFFYTYILYCKKHLY